MYVRYISQNTHLKISIEIELQMWSEIQMTVFLNLENK